MPRKNDIYGRKIVLDVVVRISESKKQEARSKRLLLIFNFPNCELLIGILQFSICKANHTYYLLPITYSLSPVHYVKSISLASYFPTLLLSKKAYLLLLASYSLTF